MRNRFVTHLFCGAVALVSVIVLPCGPAQAAETWQVGVARAVITPDEPLHLAGFAGRVVPAEGTALDLTAKALAVQDARGQRLVIVTMDLISVPSQLRATLVKTAQEKFQLPPEGLLINCSHTHCGPEMLFGPVMKSELPAERVQAGERFAARLTGQLVDLIGEAIGKLAPGKLSYVHARCGFAMNRRLKSELPTGDPYLNRPNSEGVVDHDVPVLKVESAKGELIGLMFGYACHNTTLSIKKYHGDYAGYTQAFLEKEHPGCVALFVTGCGADQNGYPRDKEKWSELHGQSLAMAVEAALQTPPRTLTPELKLAYDTVDLAYQEPPTREQLEKRQASGTGYDPGYEKYQKEWDRRRLAEYARDGKLRSAYPCPVQVLRFGPELMMVAVGGETVVDYSRRIKLQYGDQAAVWVAGYSNDVFAYLPSRRVLLEGGYESSRAMTYFTNPVHPTAFAPDVEERVMSLVETLVRKTAP